MFRLFASLACVCLLAACSTTSVGMKYSPTSAPTKPAFTASSVSVGSFIDQRDSPSNWLGAIRGGYGNPLKNIITDQPVSTLVQNAFADGLRLRGASLDSPSGFQISGIIRKLDCNQIVRQEATAEFQISIIEQSSGKLRFSQIYSAYNMQGSVLSVKTGIFASVEDLRALAEKTLSDVIDKALDDAPLRAALQ